MQKCQTNDFFINSSYLLQMRLLTVPQCYNISPTSPQPVGVATLAGQHANSKINLKNKQKSNIKHGKMYSFQVWRRVMDSRYRSILEAELLLALFDKGENNPLCCWLRALCLCRRFTCTKSYITHQRKGINPQKHNIASLTFLLCHAFIMWSFQGSCFLFSKKGLFGPVYYRLTYHLHDVPQVAGSDCTSNPGTGKFAWLSAPWPEN